MQEFMEAFGSIINRDGSMTQEQIARLFMQIDANSDGGIDWNEFSTYMLMESQVLDQYASIAPTLQWGQNAAILAPHLPTNQVIHQSICPSQYQSFSPSRSLALSLQTMGT
jgi:hypothetical protein